jgi:ABC-type uncharacterized transport system, ATPase component
MDILQMKQVDYQVDGEKILNNLSLDITEGDFLTLIGPSGSGKSTILKLLANLISQTSGEIYYKEKLVSEIEPTEHRKKVSYCFQQPSLFGQTVEDNLAFPYQIRKEEASDQVFIQSLESVNLDKSYLKKEITDLSGGEKQRVALLRNLMFPPKVLLLDEITTGLDSDNKQIIQKLIQKKHAEGITIVQVTHDADEIAAAKNIKEISKVGQNEFT